MTYFERLQAIEQLIAEFKAEQQITTFLERDGVYVRSLSHAEPGSEDTPDIDVDDDPTPYDFDAEKDANDYEA